MRPGPGNRSCDAAGGGGSLWPALALRIGTAGVVRRGGGPGVLTRGGAARAARRASAEGPDTRRQALPGCGASARRVLLSCCAVRCAPRPCRRRCAACAAAVVLTRFSILDGQIWRARVNPRVDLSSLDQRCPSVQWASGSSASTLDSGLGAYQREWLQRAVLRLRPIPGASDLVGVIVAGDMSPPGHAVR